MGYRDTAEIKEMGFHRFEVGRANRSGASPPAAFLFFVFFKGFNHFQWLDPLREEFSVLGAALLLMSLFHLCNNATQ